MQGAHVTYAEAYCSQHVVALAGLRHPEATMECEQGELWAHAYNCFLAWPEERFLLACLGSQELDDCFI